MAVLQLSMLELSAVLAWLFTTELAAAVRGSLAAVIASGDEGSREDLPLANVKCPRAGFFSLCFVHSLGDISPLSFLHTQSYSVSASNYSEQAELEVELAIA